MWMLLKKSIKQKKLSIRSIILSTVPTYKALRSREPILTTSLTVSRGDRSQSNNTSMFLKYVMIAYSYYTTTHNDQIWVAKAQSRLYC